MAFQGSLDELPLPDVIQLVTASGKTGRFAIRNRLGDGEVYLSDGEIVHAEVGDIVGEEAFYELATWQHGEFVFSQGDETAERTIEKSNTNLLMEAAHRIDEWKVLVTRVPSTRMVPTFNEEGGRTPVSLTPAEWQVVRKIDETRSIKQIAAELGLSPFEVSKTIYGLITSGLVELGEAGETAQSEQFTELSAEQLRELAAEIHRTSESMLAALESPPSMETSLRETRMQIDGGNGAAALAEMIRAHEKSILSELGSNQAHAFHESIQRLVRQQ